MKKMASSSDVLFYYGLFSKSVPRVHSIPGKCCWSMWHSSMDLSLQQTVIHPEESLDTEGSFYGHVHDNQPFSDYNGDSADKDGL